MRLVMTLLVRNEESIVRQNIEYHLSRGVDFIVATDNRSEDGTRDILGEYERVGVLRYLYEPGDDHSQDLWVTRMAALASRDHAADWIIHVDADEFWWPERHDRIPQALAGLATETVAVAVPRCNFVRSSEPGLPFHAAMRWRECNSRSVTGHPLPGKVAHRPLPGLEVESGNHALRLHGQRLALERCDGLTVFHFPLRDVAGFRKKIRWGGAALARNTRLPRGVGRTWRELYRLELEGRLEPLLMSQVAGTDQLAARVAAGELVPDDRFARYMDALQERLAGATQSQARAGE